MRYAAQGQNLLSKKDLKALRGRTIPSLSFLQKSYASGQLTELFPSLDEKTLEEILPEGQAKAGESFSAVPACGIQCAMRWFNRS